MSFAKLSHRQQHNPILLNNFNTNAAPTGLLKTSPSSNSPASSISSSSSNCSKVIKKPMPQMPANLQHSQFLPPSLRQPSGTSGTTNSLNDFSAAFTAAYPTPFGPMNTQTEAAALAMFSQLQHQQQNASPGQDPRVYPNSQNNPNYAMAAAAYAAQYGNDPISASMLGSGGYPYSSQGTPGNQIPPQIYQNFMMSNLPANNAASPSSQISSSQQHNQEGSGSTRRKNATRETTATLKAWLYEHRKNPYPTKGEKIMLAIITKMSLNQVSTWFANARRRLKKENKMTFSPRNRTAEDIDSDDETQSKSKKKNGSTSSDNMNFDDLDDLDDIDNEELEGGDDEENEEDSFSYSNEKQNQQQQPNQQQLITPNKIFTQQQQLHLANINNSMKHGMGPGMLGHANQHGHHPYFNGQQFIMHQQQHQLQQHQQNAQYLQSLFQPGQIDANKMMSLMLQSSVAFNGLQSPLNNTQEQQKIYVHPHNNEKKEFVPPNKPSPTQQQQLTGSNKSNSAKPKIWSLADVATNKPTPTSSKQQKSLNTSLSSLSSSSLSSSSSSNSSTTNYYPPVSPKSTTATQPLNINASHALTPNSTAPLSNSSSSHQNQSPKSSLSTNSNESNTVNSSQSGQLLSQQHQQLLSFFAAAAAAQQSAGFQLPFLAMQQAISKSHQQKDSMNLESEKELNNTAGENSDEENCQISLSLEITGSEVNNKLNLTEFVDEHESNISKSEDDLVGKDKEVQSPQVVITKESDNEEERSRSTKNTPQKRKMENDGETSEEEEECVVSAKRQKSNIIK